MEQDMTEPSIELLRRASIAVYIACEESVAADISKLLLWSANEIERSSRRVTALEMVIREELPPLSCGCDANRMLVDDIHIAVGTGSKT